MNPSHVAPIPRWYWAIAVVALLWNLMGCGVFLMEVFAQEAMMESMTEEQKEWTRSIPGWIYFVFALSVVSGVAGSIGLLLRKPWSVVLFAFCLAAVIVQMVYTVAISGGFQVMGPSSLVMPILVTAIASALLGFSWSARNKGLAGLTASSLGRRTCSRVRNHMLRSNATAASTVATNHPSFVPPNSLSQQTSEMGF